MRRRLLALAAMVFAVVAGSLLLAGPASAHASVVASDPIDGSRLKTAPTVVTITFDEPVGLGSVGYLHVTDQSGQRVDAGAAYHPDGVGSKVADKLKAGLGDGSYTASFRIVSADSHPVAGTVRFVVGNGALGAATGPTGATVDPGTSIVFDIARWVSYGGFALIGGAWVLITVWPAGRDELRARRLVWAGVGGIAVGGVAELLLQGPYSAGTGLAHVFTWSLIDSTLHSPYGHAHSIRLLLLGAMALLLGWLLEREERSRVDLLVPVLGVAVAWTFASVGHAATTSPAWLSEVIDMLHLLGMAGWLGGIVMLVGAVLPRREIDEVRTVLPVVSRVAFAAVTVLALSGTYQAWRGVGTYHALLRTTYGWLVVLKIALFVGVLLVANGARRAVLRRFVRVPVAYAMSSTVDDVVLTGSGGPGDPPEDIRADAVAVERVRRSVLVEIVLAIAVLVATSVLVAQPRGKEALAVAQQRPAAATASLGNGRLITVTVDPGKHGTVSVAVALNDGAAPVGVSATASLPAKQLGPIPVGLSANGANAYGASGLVLPVAGRWQFALVVTFSTFNAVTTSVTIHLY